MAFLYDSTSARREQDQEQERAPADHRNRVLACPSNHTFYMHVFSLAPLSPDMQPTSRKSNNGRSAGSSHSTNGGTCRKRTTSRRLTLPHHSNVLITWPALRFIQF